MTPTKHNNEIKEHKLIYRGHLDIIKKLRSFCGLIHTIFGLAQFFFNLSILKIFLIRVQKERKIMFWRTYMSSTKQNNKGKEVTLKCSRYLYIITHLEKNFGVIEFFFRFSPKFVTKIYLCNHLQSGVSDLLQRFTKGGRRPSLSCYKVLTQSLRVIWIQYNELH